MPCRDKCKREDRVVEGILLHTDESALKSITTKGTNKLD